jgi:phosphoribosyl 1,2-cyclic phosphodiesterase
VKPLEICFLGTGGGRFTMITQRRRTAGIRLLHGDTNIHIDPGPGALIFSNWAKINPQRLNGVIVTHCHPDHYTDAEVLIEAMSHGTREKRGILAAPSSVLSGNNDCDSSISSYHQKLVKEIHRLKPGQSFRVDEIEFEAVKSWHSDPDSVGLKFNLPDIGTIGYTSDTGYKPELIKSYNGVRLLIACTMWPNEQYLHMHLNTNETLKLIEEIKPECAIITHFGMRMLNADPEEEASYLEDSSGIPTIAARDGMRVILLDRIEVYGQRKKDKPRFIYP